MTAIATIANVGRKTLAALIQSFFTARLMTQRKVSAHTITAYSDTFRLLLAFASESIKKAPVRLSIQDIDSAFVLEFLNHLEAVRHNGARTRNHRLAAIRAFFKYVSFEEPSSAELASLVLAIPAKKYDARLVKYLDPPEVDAMLASPDRLTRWGLRDHALLQVAIGTGLRASELIGLRWADAVLGRGPHVRCFGKGRKERCTPLTKAAVQALKEWRDVAPQGDWIFVGHSGESLTRDGLRYIVAGHARRASRCCPSLVGKRVSPHVLRHTTAVRLLRAGVDRSVIALWLGHASLETTQVYLEADMSLKEAALLRSGGRNAKRRRFRAPDALLAFLKEL